MFLLSAICSLIFLQSKDGKDKLFEKGTRNHLFHVSQYFIFIRKLWERAKHLRYFKREPWVCKI